MRDEPLRGVGLMLAAAASFAAMNAFGGGLAHAGVPWPMVSFARASIGLGATYSIARMRGASLQIAQPSTMWLRSLAGTTGMVATFFALAHLPLSDATALLNTTPLWLAALAWITLREEAGAKVLTAIVIAAAGIALIERPSFGAGNLAGVVALSTGATGAVAMVSLRRLSRETPEAVVVHFSAVAAAVTGALTVLDIARHGWPSALSGSHVVSLVATGLCATSGQLLMTRAYALDRAARVGATGWMQVVFALLLDRLVVGRTPPIATLAGIACIVVASGVLLVDAHRDERRLRAAR